MPLVGSLQDLSLPELLTTIDRGEKTGVISIRSDAGTAQIHVQSGRIVLASDSLRDERFGEILVKIGKISHEDLTVALEAQRENGDLSRLGEILVGSRVITRADQNEALLYQTCEAVYDLCTWQVGFFQFDAHLIPEPTGIAVPVPTILEEVARRAKAEEHTRRQSLAHAPDAPLRARRDLTPDKLELLRLSRSFNKKTDEFAPHEEGEPAGAPADDVRDLELGELEAPETERDSF